MVKGCTYSSVENSEFSSSSSSWEMGCATLNILKEFVKKNEINWTVQQNSGRDGTQGFSFNGIGRQYIPYWDSDLRPDNVRDKRKY